jgi:archaellum biogenesis protein FlaJ (TadC family)
LEEKEQDVRQMDAVTNGLIAGGTTSLLLIIVGVVVAFSDAVQNLFNARVVILSLFFVMAITIGQFILSVFLVSAFAAAPTQTDKVTVA